MFGSITSMFGSGATTDQMAISQEVEVMSRRLEQIELMAKILVVQLGILAVGVWLLVFALIGRRIQTAVAYLAATVTTAAGAFTALVVRVSLTIAAYSRIAALAAAAFGIKAAAGIEASLAVTTAATGAATVRLAQIARQGLEAGTAIVSKTFTLATATAEAKYHAAKAVAAASTDTTAITDWLILATRAFLRRSGDMVGIMKAKEADGNDGNHTVLTNRNSNKRVRIEERFGGMGVKTMEDKEDGGRSASDSGLQDWEALPREGD